MSQLLHPKVQTLVNPWASDAIDATFSLLELCEYPAAGLFEKSLTLRHGAGSQVQFLIVGAIIETREDE